MIQVSISDAKRTLSSLIDRAKAGESIILLDRGIPVARIETARTSAEEGNNKGGRIARLYRAGTVATPRSTVSEKRSLLTILEDAPPTPATGASLLDALLEERKERR